MKHVWVPDTFILTTDVLGREPKSEKESVDSRDTLTSNFTNIGDAECCPNILSLV